MFGLVTLWHKFGIDQLKRLLNVYFLTTRELMIYYGWKIRVKYDFYGYQVEILMLFFKYFIKIGLHNLNKSPL